MAFTKQQRIEIYEKYKGHCAYCGCEIKLKDMQVDHIIPKRNWTLHMKSRSKIPCFLSHLTEDDLNHKDNLMPACRICNKWKSAHDLEVFRSEIYEQVKKLNIYSSNYRMAKKFRLVEETIKPIIFYFEV